MKKGRKERMKKYKTKSKNNVGRKAGTNELTNGKTEKSRLKLRKTAIIVVVVAILLMVIV